jgi:hypothetical protein
VSYKRALPDALAASELLPQPTRASPAIKAIKSIRIGFSIIRNAGCDAYSMPCTVTVDAQLVNGNG